MDLATASAQRRAVLADVARRVPSATGAPVKVAVDGVDGAGKSVFAEQLAQALVLKGRPVIRASVDDFHRPCAERYRRGRSSPVGFWLDSYDYDKLRRDLLDPLSSGGSRRYRTAVHDVDSDRAIDQLESICPENAVLVIDGIFLHRDEVCGYWDLSVWLDVPFTVTAARMARRDGSPADPGEPAMARYVGGQRLYLSACTPAERADIVIDNSAFDRPVLAPTCP